MEIQEDSTSFQELLTHLAEVEKDPESTRLNADLLREAQNSLGPNTPREAVWAIIANGERLLNVLHEDPKPLTRLLEKDVLLIPFDEIREAIPPLKLEQGLSSPSTSVRVLCLAYLRKAAESPSGAAWVGTSPVLTKCLVSAWLASDSTEVAERALETIILLLAVDHALQVTQVVEGGQVGEAQGQGLLWRRLFHDPEIYVLFFYWTSFKSYEYRDRSKNAVHKATISQARLFDFLARAAEIDWAGISHSHFPEIESKYCEPSAIDGHGRASLLQYAASGMVDMDDPLMVLLRRDFFTKLLATVEERKQQSTLPRKLLEFIQKDVGDSKELSTTAAGVTYNGIGDI